jgi:hypothetical protein
MSSTTAERSELSERIAEARARPKGPPGAKSAGGLWSRRASMQLTLQEMTAWRRALLPRESTAMRSHCPARKSLAVFLELPLEQATIRGVLPRTLQSSWAAGKGAPVVFSMMGFSSVLSSSSLIL